jgi:PAS domain S-box-containing protein
MNVIRNLSLRYKLVFLFLFLAVLSAFGIYSLRWFIVTELADDVLPTQALVSEFGQLVNDVRAEALEYVALGEAETVEDYAGTAAKLTTLSSQLSSLGNDAGEDEVFAASEATALSIVDVGQQSINAHDETLALLETLAEVEEEKEVAEANLDTASLAAESPQVIELLAQMKSQAEHIHTETLEYTLSSGAAALEELDEYYFSFEQSMAALQVELAAGTVSQTAEVEAVADRFAEIVALSPQVTTSHAETLALLEELEELEGWSEEIRLSLLELANNDAQTLLRVTDASVWISAIVGQLLYLTVGLLIARAIIRPILKLSSAAKKLERGEYDTRVVVDSTDEIGALSQTFNLTAQRMKEVVADLRQHSQALATSSEVSHRLSTILDTAELTTAVVELLKVQFNYYHAHIYLLDEAREYLVMAGGTGVAGEALLANGHKIEVGRGLVGRTAANNAPTLVPDVLADSDWLPNPLLPDTQAEIAVPITLEGEVLGVLDVQNRIAGSLSEEDVEMLQSVARQVAIGLQNARLFAISQQEKAQAQAILNSISLPIVISRISTGLVAYVNEALTQTFLLSREALIGQLTPDFYADPADRVTFLTKVQEERGVKDFEVVLKRGNGTEFWAMLSATLVIYDGEPAILASVVDIEARKQVEAILAKNATELSIVAEVSTAAATVLDPQELLQQVADLTKSKFDLYHAHIHLLDDSGQTLVLTAGAGEVGRQMVAEGRRIPLAAEGSLVASVARTVKGAIRIYEGAGEGFMPHPLLADTRSEMAVPIALGRQVLGVLDVRSDKLNYFGESDLQTVTTLASQVAVALQNARSYSRSEEALKGLQELSRRLTREGWEDYLTDQPELAYNYDLLEVKPYLNGHDGGETAVPSQDLPAFVQPLKIQGETIGQLTLPGLQDAETAEIVTAVAARLSAHLENLRLAESSEIARANAERRSEELGLINRMMSSVTTSLDLVGNMHIIAQELAQALDVSHVGIALLTKDKNYLEVVSEYPEPKDDVIGTLIPIEGNLLTERAIESGKFAIAYDAQNNTLTAPLHDLLRKRGVHMLAVVPMVVGNEFFGTVGFDQTDPNRVMSEQQMRLAETIVYQAATVVQNARLFAQTQEALAETNEQARRLALLNEMSEAVARQTTLADIVNIVLDKVPQILDVARISLHLLDDADASLLRVVGATGLAVTGVDEQVLPLADTPMAEALATRQIVSGFFETDAGRLTAYFAPLFAGEQQLGTFNIVVPENQSITESDRQILMQIASILGTVLENRQLFEEAQARADREKLLNKIVTQVAASLDLQHSLQIIVDEMATALNVDQVRVALIQPESNDLLIIAEHYDPKAPSAVGVHIPIAGNALTEEVIATRQMVVVTDAQNNPRTAPVQAMFREQGIQTVVLLPLVVNDEVLGTIGLDILDDRSFDSDTLQLAETIVYQAAVAIQNARLFEQSQAALAETETLYVYTSQLNTATNLDAVLDSAAAPGFQVGAVDALLFVYDQDTSGQAQFGQFLASSPRNVVPLGQKFPLREQPFSRYWPSDGKNVLLVGDVAEDRRLSAPEKQMLAEMNVQAVAVMFLSVVNLRLGQIVIRWHTRQTFTSVDERLYGAIAQQASAVVYNRLLFNQTEEALSETAALYQASADLNTAQTYEDVLTALRQHTVLGQGSHNVTISFFDRPWEKGQLPEEVYLLADWGGSELNQQPTRFRIDSVPGFFELVSSEEMLIHADVATDERISNEFRAILMNAMNVRAAIYMPLIIGSRRVGFINGYYPRTMTVSEGQIRRLSVLVSQAAVSVQSIYLYEQTQKALAETEALYVGSESIVLSNSEQDVLHGLIQSTMLQSLDRANIFMFDEPVEMVFQPT